MGNYQVTDLTNLIQTFSFKYISNELFLDIHFFQLQDYEEQTREKHTLNIHFETSPTGPSRGGNRDQADNGFVVQGGPWEQRSPPITAPNTASVTDFPAFGNSSNNEATSTPIGGAWGSRR